MRYELIEIDHLWIVACDGVEVSRHDDQAEALSEVATRLRKFNPRDRAALAVHFEKPRAA